MKKSLLAILLAVAMMLTAFAGCGSSAAPAGESSVSAVLASAEDAAEAGNGTAESAEAAASPEEPAVAESAEAGEASNGEAETAEFEGNPPIEYPLVDEPYTISYMQAWPPFLNEISEPSDAAMFQALEEATGISLDFIAVSTETAADDFMLRCATNDLPDMIQNGDTQYTGGGAKAIEDEILLDLYPLLEEYSHNYWNKMMTDATFYRNAVNDEGQVPSIIGYYKDAYYTDQGMWIRQDLLDKTGLDTPTTLDELEAILEAFKGMGMTDPIVVLSGGNCDLLARAYDVNQKLVDGQVVDKSLSDEGKAFYKKMNEWYNNKYINVDFVTYTTSDTKPPEDVIYSDNGGIFNEDVISIAQYVSAATNPDFDLQPLGQIRLTPDQELNTGYIGVYASDKYDLTISTQCEDPALVIQYIDFLFTDEGFMLTNWGIEDMTYTYNAAGEPEFTEMITEFDMGMQLAQSLFINPGLPCMTDLSIQELTYSDAQKAAVPTWVAAYDSSDETFPNQNWLSYTTEESQRKAELETDLETYQEEMTLKFITGQADIDTQWDTYVATCKSMGYDELQEITQASVTRYLAK